jgi:hypothetical protein
VSTSTPPQREPGYHPAQPKPASPARPARTPITTNSPVMMTALFASELVPILATVIRTPTLGGIIGIAAMLGLTALTWRMRRGARR